MSVKDEIPTKPKIIVCFTGMPGAGKSTAAKATEEMGFEILTMGDGVREETFRRGLPLNDENVGLVMLDLRKKNGEGAVAKLILPKIVSSKNRLIAIDGVRNLEEVEAFKKAGLVKILAIHAPHEIRYKFLTRRGRQDAPTSNDISKIRDDREISVGVAKVIALADEIISNSSISIEDLIEETRKIVGRWVTENED